MLGATTLSLALLFGVSVVSVTWTDYARAEHGQDRDQGKKGDMKQDKKQKSQKGSEEQSNKMGGGPMGKSEVGASADGGPVSLPPQDKSPGFEGANKDQSKAPTAGGPR